jgi:hypothetical protein
MSPQKHESTKEAHHDAAVGNPNLITSAALIGVGALLEPELLAGLLIGAGIVLASSLITNVVSGVVGGVVKPIVKTAVKVGYEAVEQTRELIAGASEEVQDIMAEARAEHAENRTFQ